MYTTILAAISGTSDSSAVLREAATIATGCAAAVRVLHVRAIDTSEPTTVGGTPTTVTVVEEDAKVAGAVVTAAVAELTSAGIEAHGEVAEAMRHDVARAVWSRAEEISADLIVIGMHQRGLLASLLGSVSDQVARHADRPVLLVP